MRTSRRIAIDAAIRIIARNYTISLPDEEEEQVALMKQTIGSPAWQTMIDEIETALQDYAYQVSKR